MNVKLHIPQVGAPDPEANTSVIVNEMDEEFDVVKLEEPGRSLCYFNNKPYTHNDVVCSGITRIQCNYGIWQRVGSCDPDHP